MFRRRDISLFQPPPVTNPGLTADAWDGLEVVTAESESEWMKDGGMEEGKEQEAEEEELTESKVVA